ncbi:MAG: CotH kinase family protein, partial [Planctomycetota bacterium]
PGFGPGPGGEPGRGGPAFRPGRGGSGLELDPLAGADDPRKPLLSRLLAVPSLRARYLECVQRIAEESLDWERLGPIVEGYRSLIAKEIEADTRKLFSFAAFTDEGDEQGREVGIRTFAEARRTYLLQRIEARSASESDADSPVSREVRAREEASGRGPGAEAISQP